VNGLVLLLLLFSTLPSGWIHDSRYCDGHDRMDRRMYDLVPADHRISNEYGNRHCFHIFRLTLAGRRSVYRLATVFSVWTKIGTVPSVPKSIEEQEK